MVKKYGGKLTDALMNSQFKIAILDCVIFIQVIIKISDSYILLPIKEDLWYRKAMEIEHFKNITIQQMEAVISLVEEGSFSRAAKKMHLTQPALTKNIKSVEDCLGLRVVNRSNAGITLTAEGHVIFNYARRIIKLRNEAREKIVQMQGNTGGEIYIGASTIPATYILPSALSLFRKKYDNVRVHVQTADSEETMNMVLAGEVEIGLIGKKPLNKKLLSDLLWKDRLVLAVSLNHPWCKKKSITLEELAQEPFILREKGSATRDVLEFYLKEHKTVSLAQFNICSELGSSEAVKEAIIAGLGVSILSLHAIKRELLQGLLGEIKIAGYHNIERDFYLIRQKQLDLRPFHKLFMNFIKGYSPE
jgi:DNA-binding transcriptional LysR family regulator